MLQLLLDEFKLWGRYNNSIPWAFESHLIVQEFRGTRAYTKPTCLSGLSPGTLESGGQFQSCLTEQKPLKTSFTAIHVGRGKGEGEAPQTSVLPFSKEEARRSQPLPCGFDGHAALDLPLHTQPLAHLSGKSGKWWEYEEIFELRSRIKWNYHCKGRCWRHKMKQRFKKTRERITLGTWEEPGDIVMGKS